MMLSHFLHSRSERPNLDVYPSEKKVEKNASKQTDGNFQHAENASGKIKKLMLVTDAWQPQTNGVVTTLNHWIDELLAKGVEVEVISPEGYQKFPLPSYPEIQMVWRAPDLWQRICEFKPDALHIATEGTLGWKVRRLALKNAIEFTTGYHTKYPEYIQQRWHWISPRWVYRLMHYFHREAKKVLVPAPSIKAELEQQGFKQVGVVSRGVDTTLFSPQRAKALDYPKPIMLYVGRVAPEKNLPAFLNSELPGTKLVVGKGPELEALQHKYPDVHFVGAKYGEALAELYASADVFVFPSLTDTFGVVNIEALASGTPVAAYDVTGPKDMVLPGVNGFLEVDFQQPLDHVIRQAIELKSSVPVEQITDSVKHFQWEQAAMQFYQQLQPICATSWARFAREAQNKSK